MRPICEITIDGQPASGLFMERLTTCTVTDEEGISSDRVEIDLADDPPAEIPRRGAVLSVTMGYAGALSFMGEFIAEEVEVSLMPYTMRITGKSADLGGKAKDQKDRHWDDVTLGDLVAQIAAEHGLKSAVAPELAGFTYPWIGQLGESDTAFLERLAQRHQALFAIKAGTVIFARRGSGAAPSGAELTPLVIRPQALGTTGNLLKGSGRVTFSERTRYAEVTATYMDRAGGRRREVTVEAEPEGEGAFTLDQPYASEAEAREAATAKAAEMRRRAVTFSADILGDPAARGGAPATFADLRPGVDGLVFIIETAVHRFAKSGGYTTSLNGSLKA